MTDEYIIITEFLMDIHEIIKKMKKPKLKERLIKLEDKWMERIKEIDDD